MSDSERAPLPPLATRLPRPHRTVEQCQLWAFGLAQMGPCRSALPLVALWALCELLRAWAMEGG